MTAQRDGFKRHLLRQLAFLKRSCHSYDHGFEDEAIRIAVVLRVLFHDTRRSVSLFRHLGAQGTPIISTCSMVPPKANVHFFEGMGMSRFGPGGASYFAPLGAARIHVPTPAPLWWWQIVSVQGPGLVIRRRDIVLGAANKDGGAHVDPDLTAEYAAISADGAVGEWVWGEGNDEKRAPITGAHFVYIRQMAYEVLASPALRDLCDL